jgi:hypothetical protein
MTYIEDTQDNNWQSVDNSFQATNLIFVDTNLTDYQNLISNFNNDLTAVYLINSQQNGIKQISEALENYSNLESIQIFSHGNIGLLQLGNTNLSAINLNLYQDELDTWGDALSESGDLLFYGCNLGANQEGFDFVNQIANFTGADVAASNNLTGNANLSGDWILEVATGKIETTTLSSTEYNEVLVVNQYNKLNGITADFNGDGKADFLRQEKGIWDDDNSNIANLLISTGTGFNQINLPPELDLKGDYTNLYVGDFNGDGKSDLFRQEKASWDNDIHNTANLLISTGTGFNKIVLSEDLWLHGDFTNLYVGDFNGDGKSDLLRQEKGTWDDDAAIDWGTVELLTSTGTGFINDWLPPGLSLAGDFTNLYVGDFNGDGKSDLLRQEKGVADNDNVNTANLLISTGTGFNSIALAETFALKGDLTNLYVGDFNGDGKSDLLRQEKSTWDNDNVNTANLLISTGTGFNSIALAENLYLKGDLTNLYVGDFNGDGKSDLLRQEKGFADNDTINTASLLISTGTNFNSTALAESFNIGGDHTNLYTGDFTGDGKSDIIRQDKGWYDFNQPNTQQVARLLTSTGTNFSATNLNSSFALSGNYTNIITNNVISKYLADNDKDGLKFNFTYDTSVTWDQKQAFEFAGQMWSEYLKDDVTVNIHVSMVNNSDLPSNTLGGAVPFFYQGTSYTDFKNKLSQDVDAKLAQASGNNDDQVAVANLDTGSTVQVASPNNTHAGVWRNFDRVAMTRANAKALGFIDGENETLDGTIVMNNLVGTSVGWQYDYFSNGVGTSKIDFTTVAIHEIGHTLGFVSVVDGLTNSNYTDQTLLNSSVTVLDLYRFMSQGVRTIRTGSGFFSLDKGTTSSARVSYGVSNIGGDFNADGYQGSHWKNEDNQGIMDPLLETNVRRQIGGFDVRALDVIGWDRKFASSSWDVMASDAWNAADERGNINRNTDVNAMLQDWRWARGSSGGTLRQEGNIGQFLAQQGFFSVGAFRESFDFSSVNSQQNTTLERSNFEDNLLTIIDRFDDQKSTSKLTLDTLQPLRQLQSYSNFNDDDSEEKLTTLAEWFSSYKSGELSLDDLKQLLEEIIPSKLMSYIE